MSRLKRIATFVLLPTIAAGAVATAIAFASTPTASGPVAATIPFTYAANKSAESPTTTLLEADGLKLTDTCASSGGRPTQKVKATSSVSNATLLAGYNVGGAADTNGGHLNEEPLSVFSGQETGTDGTQLAGTMTYTTPADANVTITYQWWTGDEVKGLTSECVFAGIASVAGG